MEKEDAKRTPNASNVPTASERTARLGLHMTAVPSTPEEREMPDTAATTETDPERSAVDAATRRAAADVLWAVA